MKLFELEAKALLEQAGVAVPRGHAAGAADQLGDLIAGSGPPWVAKVQVLEGRRGQRGGVRIVHSAEELRGTATSWWRDGFDGRPVDVILVEEFVPAEQELFLHLSIDPRACGPVFLAGPKGGVDVESHASRVARVPVDPLIGYQPYVGRMVCDGLLGGAAQRGQVEQLVRLAEACYRVFERRHLQMLEINPLARREDGTFLALDAKAEADPVAAESVVRSLGDRLLPRTEEPVLAMLHGFGHKYVSIPGGDVAVLAVGAGEGMALFDELTQRGVKVGLWVDMNPQDADGVAETLAAVLSTGPRLVVIQAFFQLGDCANYAKAIAAVTSRAPTSVWACRFDGRGADRATEILEAVGIQVTRSLGDLVAVAAQAGAPGRESG